MQIVFLGILLDGTNMILAIPEDKRLKALNLVRSFINRKKATVKELQSLCGLLNFLNKAIYPGRAFLRRMYAKYGNITDKKTYKTAKHNGIRKTFHLKLHHHIRLDAEFKADCKIWEKFLQPEENDLRMVVNRPMLDIEMFQTSKQIKFYSDASAAKDLGFGCIFGKNWVYGRWEENFIEKYRPSIEFLELFALCAGLFTWEEKLKNCIL